MRRTLLVTGAGGQLGSRILEIADPASTVAATSADLDITDPTAVAQAIGPATVVINCAAYTAVDAAESDLERAMAVNATGPAMLAQRCAQVGAHLIHVSTDYVFAGTADTPYEVDGPIAPATAYGRSKAAGEAEVHRHLPGATIVRTAWVYSGGPTDFVGTMLRLERERDTVDVVNDQVGSPTYAADLAAALLELAAREPGSAPPLLHATNAGTATWFDLAQAVFAEVGADPQRVRPCSSAQFVRPAPRPPYSVLSGRVWAQAGLTPLRPWREAVAAAVARVADQGTAAAPLG